MYFKIDRHLQHLLLGIVSILFFSQPIPASASSDIGFRFIDKKFSLTVRFGFAQLEEVTKDKAREIVRADKLFYQTLAWFYRNKSHLSGLKKEVTVFWNIPRNSFNISVYEDNNTTGDIKYSTGHAAVTLQRQLDKLFNLKTPAATLPESIPLLLIRSSRPFQSDTLDTDVFFGSIPGSMHSRSERSYLQFLWSLDAYPTWIRELEKNAASLQPIRLDTKSAYTLLEELE